MIIGKIKDRYNAVVSSRGVSLRIQNILSFSNLDRDGFEYDVKERRLLLYTTKIGEKIYIQYPGKESKDIDADKIRPWDLRPKLVDKDGNWMKDLSFKDIWDDIVELQKIDKESLSILAAIFYRLSMMLDTEKVTEHYEYEDIEKRSNRIINSGTLKMEWYKVKLSDEVLSFLEEKIGSIRGFSIEAYIYYNDLLCQNEDCKYYFRDTYIKSQNWNSNIGRKNTYWTHMSIIGYLQGHIRFTQLMDMFQRGMGVAPIALRDIPLVTSNIINR